MREDIIGMLKNAIEHGGNPSRIAQSLINSGYPSAEVQQALTYITNAMPQPSSTQGNPNSQITPQTIQQPAQKTTISISPPQSSNQQSTSYFSQNQKMPTPPVYQNPQVSQTSSPPQTPQFIIKPLPSTKGNLPRGTWKLIFMIFILLALVGSLISVIIFKDKILDWIS
ncbi:MAG: hypothetical protein AABX96_02600 [Nanoarchaeota archaeon]